MDLINQWSRQVILGYQTPLLPSCKASLPLSFSLSLGEEAALMGNGGLTWMRRVSKISQGDCLNPTKSKIKPTSFLMSLAQASHPWLSNLNSFPHARTPFSLWWLDCSLSIAIYRQPWLKCFFFFGQIYSIFVHSFLQHYLTAHKKNMFCMAPMHSTYLFSASCMYMITYNYCSSIYFISTKQMDIIKNLTMYAIWVLCTSIISIRPSKLIMFNDIYSEVF